jgi:hypothetical protein
MQLAQCCVAVVSGEPSVLVDPFARHDDEVDSAGAALVGMSGESGCTGVRPI